MFDFYKICLVWLVCSLQEQLYNSLEESNHLWQFLQKVSEKSGKSIRCVQIALPKSILSIYPNI